MQINLAAVLVSTVLFYAIGAAWYSVLSKPWMNALEKTMEEIKNVKNMPTTWFAFVLSFVCIAVLTLVLAYITYQLNVTSAVDGMLLGGLLWFGFVATSMLTNIGYADRKFMLFVIDSGYFLVGMVVSGAILAVWR